MMSLPLQLVLNSRVSCYSLLGYTFFMIAKNLKTRTCSIVLDYPERHLLLIGCNGFVCKLCCSSMERKYGNPAILLLMHYLLLWNGLYFNHVKCLYDGATCMTTVLTVYQSKLTWDRHQGLDLGVQGHINLVFNE